MLFLGGKAREHRLKFINTVLQLPNFEEDNFISIQKSAKMLERKLDGFITDIKVLDKFAEPNQLGPTHLFYNESYLHTDSYFQIVTSTWFELHLERIEINEKPERKHPRHLIQWTVQVPATWRDHSAFILQEVQHS